MTDKEHQPANKDESKREKVSGDDGFTQVETIKTDADGNEVVEVVIKDNITGVKLPVGPPYSI